MKVKQYMLAGMVVALLAAGLSGCRTKEKEQSKESRSEKVVNDSITEAEPLIIEEADKNSKTEAEPSIITADYTEEFQGIRGCAVIFDESENTYTFYNEADCKERATPCSTFKIISALSGLHNQVITSEDSTMGYSGVWYPNENWNSDMNLSDAFHNSCVWYFRKVIDAVGAEEMQKELNSLGYGNCDLSEWEGSAINSYPELNGFWLESSLTISPLEQVDILKNIVEGKTIYTDSEVAVLKNIMLAETNGSTNIYGKTGSGISNNAWFVGFTENEGSNRYFAVYLQDDTADTVNGAKAKEITMRILIDN